MSDIAWKEVSSIPEDYSDEKTIVICPPSYVMWDEPITMTVGWVRENIGQVQGWLDSLELSPVETDDPFGNLVS